MTQIYQINHIQISNLWLNKNDIHSKFNLIQFLCSKSENSNIKYAINMAHKFTSGTMREILSFIFICCIKYFDKRSKFNLLVDYRGRPNKISSKGNFN